MCQVLFRLPIPGIQGGLPFYGFGVMLFFAFIICTWLASRRAKREGVPPQIIQDLAIWIFIGGIVGARVVYMIQYDQPLTHFFYIWQGGLVFYGSAAGGVIAYALAYYFVLRKQNVSTWKIADIIAPSAAIGLCLGRVGCLLNGCCYGNVACPHCVGIQFPLSAPARMALVERGVQTPAGFTLTDDPDADPRTIDAVEPGSPAADSGLKRGDIIEAVNGHSVEAPLFIEFGEGENLERVSCNTLGDCERQLQGVKKKNPKELRVGDDLTRLLVYRWERGENKLTLTIRRKVDGKDQEVTIGPFRPLTVPLHPTQVYESISTLLLFLLLTAYYPFHRNDGQVMALFMIGYSVHRFLNEMLRNDTDPVAFGMTLSQNGSILIFVAGLALWIWRARSPT